MTIGVEAVIDPVRVYNNLHHNYFNNVSGGTEALLTASHPQQPPAHYPLCFQRWATPTTHLACYHIIHRVTQLIQMMTVYWWIMIHVSVSCSYHTVYFISCVCVVSGSASSLKKHKQHLGHEGRRKELASKMLDGVEYRGQQHNVSPSHSSQLKINSKKR